MSSLGISVLILAVAAIIAVVAVNLSQALARRRRLGLGPRRGVSAAGRAGDAATAPPASDPEALAAPVGPGQGTGRGSPRPSRREPRLGEMMVDADEDGQALGLESGQALGGKPGPRPADEARAGDFRSATGPMSFTTPAMTAGFQPGSGAAPATAKPGAPALPAGADTGLLSPVCDCIVTLALESPIDGERLNAMTRGVRRAGAKPVLVEGVPVGMAGEDSIPLIGGVAFKALRIGVLLANRHGPLNAMEYSEFVASVQTVADSLSTLADTPDMADAIALARDLDSTCAQLDAQIGINIEMPEPIGPHQVSALAGELGLVERGGHRHAFVGPQGELVFTMALGDSPRRLGFLLDVPRTPEVLGAWVTMVSCAQDLARRLSGRLVDDAGRAIPADSLGTIGRQLQQRYESLEAIGLPAGSPLAMRVFN